MHGECETHINFAAIYYKLSQTDAINLIHGPTTGHWTEDVVMLKDN